LHNIIVQFINSFCYPVGRDRDTDDLGTDEIRADGMVYRDKKDQLEVAIGDGMEFTIHGKEKN
jgi:hypothetical protein